MFLPSRWLSMTLVLNEEFRHRVLTPPAQHWLGALVQCNERAPSIIQSRSHFKRRSVYSWWSWFSGKNNSPSCGVMYWSYGGKSRHKLVFNQARLCVINCINKSRERLSVDKNSLLVRLRVLCRVNKLVFVHVVSMTVTVIWQNIDSMEDYIAMIVDVHKPTRV